MRLTTEMLPRLAERADVAVEVVGEPADYRDVGDSLTIGVSTADIAGERDWFDLGVTISVDGHELPFAEVFTALASGESHMLLADGAHFSLLEPGLQELRRLIEEARSLADSPSAALRISRYQAGLWAELAALGVVSEQAQAWQRQVGALLEIDTIAKHDPPATLQAQLRPYQRDGFGWLASLWELELGGILADDMGLGKTLQTLALICHARERDPDVGPFLVVAPTSVVSNWVGEAARFAPELKVDAVTDTLARSRTHDRGARRRRRRGHDVHAVPARGRRLPHGGLGGADPRRGAVRQEPPGQDLPMRPRAGRALQARDHRHADGEQPDGAVVAAVDHRARAVPRPEAVRRAVRAADRDAAATPSSSHACGAGSSRSSCAARRSWWPPICPAKQEQTLDVELHPRHRKLYDTHLQRERQKVLGLIDDFDRNRFAILRSLTLLRQLSLHPGLVDDDHDAVPCAKLDALVEQLGDMIGDGHRALVFSQFTGFLAQGPRAPRRRGHRATATSTAAPAGATGHRRVQGRRRPRVPDQPQGRRVRPQPHRGRLLLPARPVVEPRRRGPGDRPHPPHRPDPTR